MCVLDFCVAPARWRRGLGLALFRGMMEAEGALDAAAFAFDRPSDKMRGFLRKHFGLADYVAQPNNFVLFDRHFSPP